MHAEILDKSQEKIWDKFVFDHPLGNISQTSKWGHFQSKIFSRGKYWIIALKEKEKIIGGTMLIRHKMAKNYSWLYSARGPLLNYKEKDLNEKMQALLKIISKIAREENSVFYRIDPPLDKFDYPKLPKLKNFYTSHLGFQPENTLVLDLSKSEERLLSEMKPKGRYNIRLAEKKGVRIRYSDPREIGQFQKDLDAFHKILHETTMRDKFYGHKKNVYKDMLETLALDSNFKNSNDSIDIHYSPCAKLCLAEHQNEIIAGLIATFYKDTATYYYGASSDKFRNVMAPYLLQWTVIKEAKNQGYKIYDFLGISPPKAKNHPWRGVTEFKKKFGGQEVDFHPAQEYPFKKLLFFFYRFIKFMKN